MKTQSRLTMKASLYDIALEPSCEVRDTLVCLELWNCDWRS